MAKYLKHIHNVVTIYSSGRTDFLTVNAIPGLVVLYDDIINEDNMSVNYNAHIWDDYIQKGYWTVIVGPIIWEDLIISVAVHSVGVWYRNGGGSISWPVSGAAEGSVVSFIQGAYSDSDLGYSSDSFILTTDNITLDTHSWQLIYTPTDPVISNGAFALNFTLRPYASPLSLTLANYTCTLKINGKLLTALAKIEFLAEGS